ncbi:MAG TPA: hypothetical protein VHW93_09885, partial [Acidimicrobiales bacterium]|nr:hypothetical protein [Acidimicrobiales bacterium]
AHLVAAGVDVTSLEEPGMFHVFPILMPWADSSRRTFHEVGEFVRARLPGSAPAGAAGEDIDASGSSSAAS